VLAIHPDFANWEKRGYVIVYITMDVVILNGCTEGEWEGVWKLEFSCSISIANTKPKFSGDATIVH